MGIGDAPAARAKGPAQARQGNKRRIPLQHGDVLGVRRQVKQVAVSVDHALVGHRHSGDEDRRIIISSMRTARVPSDYAPLAPGVSYAQAGG